MPITHFSTDAEIERIWDGLLDRALPKREWTHAAHFAAALWLLRWRGDLNAPAAMPELIRAYNEATGVPNTDSDGYHETITLASLRAARAMLALHWSEEPLSGIANALMASPLGRSDWVLTYWTRELLFSPRARREWVPSNLKAFPF
jgi:hypothetical protein